MTMRWYVVQAKAGADKAAQQHVESLGIEVLRPQMLQVARRRGRKVERIVPLFRGYMFARFDASVRGDWVRISYPYKVARLVSFNPPFFHPTAVPEWMIAEIVSELGRTGLISRASEKAKPFQSGEAVRVLEGPFRSFIGKVVGLDDRQRVEVLLGLFGRECRVALEPDDLQSA